jgi:ABC-2 type transport system permease protein
VSGASSRTSGGVNAAREFFSVAGAVAGRQVRRAFTNASFFLPSLFPVFFFVAFAGGLTRVGEVPGFDFPAGYEAFQYVWVLLQAVTFGGAFTGFAIAGDFETGFARRMLLAAHRRGGIILGYVLASFVRVTVTGALVTVAALLVGMEVGGGAVDLAGLLGLALLLNISATLFATGIALRIRTSQGGPLIQTPLFLLLFLAPVFVPLSLLEGWIHAVASVNPVTFLLEAGRGFIAGNPTEVLPAFAVGFAAAALLALWAVTGLRRAERSGS